MIGNSFPLWYPISLILWYIFIIKSWVGVCTPRHSFNAYTIFKRIILIYPTSWQSEAHRVVYVTRYITRSLLCVKSYMYMLGAVYNSLCRFLICDPLGIFLSINQSGPYLPYVKINAYSSINNSSSIKICRLLSKSLKRLKIRIYSIQKLQNCCSYSLQLQLQFTCSKLYHNHAIIASCIHHNLLTRAYE